MISLTGCIHPYRWGSTENVKGEMFEDNKVAEKCNYKDGQAEREKRAKAPWCEKESLTFRLPSLCWQPKLGTWVPSSTAVRMAGAGDRCQTWAARREWQGPFTIGAGQTHSELDLSNVKHLSTCQVPTGQGIDSGRKRTFLWLFSDWTQGSFLSRNGFFWAQDTCRYKTLFNVYLVFPKF